MAHLKECHPEKKSLLRNALEIFLCGILLVGGTIVLIYLFVLSVKYNNSPEREVDRVMKCYSKEELEIRDLTLEKERAIAGRTLAILDRDKAREERDMARVERDMARAERNMARVERDGARMERDCTKSQIDTILQIFWPTMG